MVEGARPTQKQFIAAHEEKNYRLASFSVT